MHANPIARNAGCVKLRKAVARREGTQLFEEKARTYS
jgi:hypothetical protein